MMNSPIMITLRKVGLVAVLLGLSMQSHAQVDLGGRKDQVITINRRTSALDAADQYFANADAQLIATKVADLKNPYTFEEAVEEVVVQEKKKVSKPKPVVVYDDASVLDVIAKSLTGKIRGTMAMGDDHYLQLQSGGLMKTGSSFPAKIPQNKNRVYTVTLKDVSDDEFTLGLGDIERSYPFSEEDNEPSGNIQFYRE